MEDTMNLFTSTITYFFVLGWYILSVIAMWKLFTKAGLPGWASLVPIYNIYSLYKIALGNGWWFLLLLVPLAGIFVSVYMNFRLAQAFGKSPLFGLGLVFLNSIFMLILAFGSARYYGKGRDIYGTF